MSRSVLVIQLARLGDCLQTLPVLKRLKETDPDCCLTVFCLAEFGGILESSPWCDQAVKISTADFSALLALPREEFEAQVERFLRAQPLLREDYRLVVNFSHDRFGAICHRVIRHAAYAGIRDSGEDRLRLQGDWTRYLFAQVKHRTQNLINLVDIHLGMAGVSGAPVRHYFVPRPEDRQKAEDLLCGAARPGRRLRIAFQLGASQPHRAWPTGHFAELGGRLHREHGAQIVLLGTAAEAARGRWFRSRAATSATDLMGKTGIGDLAAVLEQCDLLVSNDTGTIHLAAAVGTPTVGLFFSTAWYSETAPYGEGHWVVQADRPCSPCWANQLCPGILCRTDLSVEAVFLAVVRALNLQPDRPFRFPNVRLLRSVFLANGLMAFLPADDAPWEERRLAAALQRPGWESALEASPDFTLLAALRERVAPATLAVAADRLFRGYRALGGILRDSRAAVQSWLGAAAESKPPGPLPSLAAFGQGLEQAGEAFGLLSTFCAYRLQDLVPAPPGLAGMAFDRFVAGLENVIEGFLHTLPNS